MQTLQIDGWMVSGGWSTWACRRFTLRDNKSTGIIVRGVGLEFHSLAYRTGMRDVELSIDCWLATALTAVLPVAWVAVVFHRAWRGRARVAAGLCIGCGYDLRASQDRCPECGEAFHSLSSPGIPGEVG